ncbi:MAG: cation diffusion facilitator family transporter [Coriobacteriia bacterium]|nr:cation diffusion facilitator family transporter [Coriobacteriia bacterium]
MTTQTVRDKKRVALLSVASNTVLTLSKVFIGFFSGSVSILSEGIHSGIDLLAACIAFFAVRESGKPADDRHSYGHGKIENISGTIEALLIFVAVVLIVIEAIKKIIHIIDGSGIEMDGFGLNLGLGVMGASALINVFVSARLMRVAKRTDSVALEADALHLRTDVFTSAGVFLGILLIILTGWLILDPIIALVVAAMILKAAFDLVKKAFFPLIDVSLPEDEQGVITKVLSQHEKEFVEFHALRTRKAGAERHVDLHLVVPKHSTISEVHQLCDQIEQEIAAELKDAQVLIHTEPCDIEEVKCPYSQGLSKTCQRCRAATSESKALENSLLQQST